MKKILLMMVMLPFISFGQISSWRNNGGSSHSYSAPAPRVQSQSDNVSRWRDVSPREYNRPQQNKPGSNIIIHNDPWGWNNWGWGWNRWNMWGAPTFGFNYYSPYWYYDRWGYRQPGRVYIYENGKRDTIVGKKPIINFGLQKTSNGQIGGFFAIGNKSYFIIDYVTTYAQDNSTYFPYGNITQVDFPLIRDLKKERTLYLGAGKRIGRTGVHAMLGFGSEDVYYRGKDAIGEITFPKYSSNFTTLKIGVLHDLKNFTLKADLDPVRNYVQIGLGLNL